MAIELTSKQRQVLQTVEMLQEQNGYPPTVRELADTLGHASTAGIHKILKILQAKGHLRRGDRGKSRSLGLVREAQGRARPYPLVGRVEAGSPQLAAEEREGDLFLDESWAGRGDTFLLRVRGHSMIDADIRDGDILVVEKVPFCRNGDIVIALLEEEATVKRFFKEKDRIRLQPENPAMQAIYIPRDDPSFRIIGRVRGLLRKYF